MLVSVGHSDTMEGRLIESHKRRSKFPTVEKFFGFFQLVRENKFMLSSIMETNCLCSKALS